MSEGAASFAARLLAWFDAHGRKDLPWQRDPEPYRVWVSEIMLQQTQVVTVIPYFERFLARFPTIDTLAEAPLDDVLHLWSGLGYYARARNLHRSARILRNEHGGRFPQDLEALMSLPGIGRSTAGAILAISCGQRLPILDGNVRRVLCRYHAIDEWPGRPVVERRLWAIADRETPQQRVADYTQAIMDLGATLCTRSRPQCPRCPLQAHCRASAEGRPTAYPIAKPKTRRPERTATLLLLTNDAGEVLLERRPPSGIWGGLWSLPEVPAAAHDSDAIRDWCTQRLRCAIEPVAVLPVLRHDFSHYRLLIHPLHARVCPPGSILEGAVMEEDQHLWYNGAGRHGLAAPVVGMAAPVQRLIRQLFDTQENTDAADGPLRQTG